MASQGAVVSVAGEHPKIAVDVVEPPVAPPGGVVVDTEAVALTYVDWLMVHGGYPMPAPFVAGTQLVGVVTAVGEGAAWQLGDRVAAGVDAGACATRVAVPAARAVAVPAGMPGATVAAMLQPYSTAWCALSHRARVGAGEVVVVLGASGSVGRAAVELAERAGARVVAVTPVAPASTGGAAVWVAPDSLGDGLDTLGARSADIVIDMVGGETAEGAFRRLGPYGRHVVVGFASGTVPSFRADRVLRSSRSVLGSDTYAWFDTAGTGASADVAALLAAAHDGELSPPRPTVVDLDAAVAMLAAPTPPPGPTVVGFPS